MSAQRNADIPSLNEMMGEDELPFPLEVVLGRLRAEGIFAPWLPLDKEELVSPEAARELFRGWHEAGKLPMMAQPPEDDRQPMHPSVRSFGGAYFFGGQKTRIDEGASPFPPAVFGKNCVIRAGARLGGPFILGDEVRIGSSHISRSVIGSGTKIASNATIGDSIIGPGCVIEAGVSIRSQLGYRDKDGTIKTRRFIAGGQHVDVPTRRKVLGAIIGRGCIVEGDLEPGTVLLPQCHVRSWMRGLPAGIYTPAILDMLHRERELKVFASIAQALQPLDPES